MLNVLARHVPGILTAALLLSFIKPSLAPAAKSSPIAKETARSAYDFVNSVGVNTHLNYFDTAYGRFELVKRELESIGIRHLRDGAHLQSADYNNALYSRWRQLGSLGIRFDAVVDSRSGLGPLNTAKLEQIEGLAGDSIESFEGANEMDISNMVDWIPIDRDNQASLYQAVKAMPNGNSIQVIGPSLASASAGHALGNLSDSMDFGDLHPYPAAKPPSAVFPEQPQLAEEVSSNKPIIVTETGYHNALNDHRDQPAISETAAAKYVPRLFLEDFAHGIVRTYLYEFMDEKPDPGLTDEQQHWGLVRNDGSEKPAFAALKNLISELNDVEEPAKLDCLQYTLSGDNRQTNHLLLEKSNGQFFLVLWQEVPSYNYRDHSDIANPPLPVTLTLHSIAKSTRVYEPSRQAESIHAYSDTSAISLQVPDDPLVIAIQMQ